MKVEVEVKPPSPVRLPYRGSGAMRVEGDVVHRLVHVDGAPVLVRAWQRRSGEIVLRATPAGTSSAARPGVPVASQHQLGEAVARLRFALCLDDDLSGFYDAFKRDPLLGPVIRRKPWIRPRRAVWPWQALLRAITKQLIESGRAAAIERRIVHRWGPVMERDGRPPLRDVPEPASIMRVAPAELVGCDLTERRALAMIRCAREAAAGRVDLADPGDDRHLLAIREIGPWTVQCLRLDGRGDPDSLPAGDLGYIKLVGRLAGKGRRATVEEVEEFFAPYEPYRGLAGTFALVGLHKHVATGRPLRLAA